MKKIYYLIFIVFLVENSYSQTYKIPTTPLLKYLYSTHQNVSSITNTMDSYFIPEENIKPNSYQKLIKNNNGLFITIDGTGKVFKAIELEKDYIIFKRIDSTFNFGNTYFSIDFSYKDTLFSFGGYGNWHKNGQLRRFNSSNEWSIEKLNNLRNSMYYLYNYLPKKNKLFYFEPLYYNEETKSEKEGNYAIMLDIEYRTNTILGKINSKVILPNYLFIDIPKLNGTLIKIDNTINLIDIENNKIYNLKNKYINDILIDKSTFKIQNTFAVDDTIYYNNYPDTILKSIKISINDFEETPEKVYILENKNSNLLLIVIPIFFILITFLIIIKKKFNEKKLKLNKNINDETDFNTLEKELVEKLINVSKDGNFFTVDDVNLILGTKNKHIDIQKNIRTEVINRINYKFNFNCKNDKILIKRVRSSEDARFMNYFIDNDCAAIFKKYIIFKK